MSDVDESPEDTEERARALWAKVRARLVVYLVMTTLAIAAGGAASVFLWGLWGLVLFACVALGALVWVGRQLLYY